MFCLQCARRRSASANTSFGLKRSRPEFFGPNESVYIPLGSKHRLSNPGKINLTLIEVQSGSYVGEDDIVRFEDKYKRKTI